MMNENETQQAPAAEGQAEPTSEVVDGAGMTGEQQAAAIDAGATEVQGLPVDDGATEPAATSDASTAASLGTSAQGSVGEDPQSAEAAPTGAGAPSAGSDPVEKGDLYESNDELLAAIDTKPGEKVTKDYMDSRIAKVAYAKIDETVTVCSITLDNGYSVRGESACVDPVNFDEKIGKSLAYQDAYRKLWQLFGFRLAEARHLRAKAA